MIVTRNLQEGISIGSIFEVVSGLAIARERGFISPEVYDEIYIDAEILAKRSTAFEITSLQAIGHKPSAISHMPSTKILVIDDEKLVCWTLEDVLGREGYEVISAESGEAGLKLIEEESPDLVLLDLRLPRMDGMEVLDRIKEIEPEALVIILTAHGTVESAVEAMKKGAYDYINKPFDLGETKLTLKKALETLQLKKEVAHLRREQRERFGLDDIISVSEAMRDILEMVKRIAKSDATTVLIHGESGTGKELLAKAIHYHSSRADKPFMTINCTALPETLVESELFGHEKGAFTDAKYTKKGLLELANGGTVLLIEIGDMRPSTQAKLLRVIEDKNFKRVGGTRDIHVDVRIIATTNRDLSHQIKEGTFREDLYYRLKVFLLPSLPSGGALKTSSP